MNTFEIISACICCVLGGAFVGSLVTFFSMALVMITDEKKDDKL